MYEQLPTLIAKNSYRETNIRACLSTLVKWAVGTTSFPAWKFVKSSISSEEQMNKKKKGGRFLLDNNYYYDCRWTSRLSSTSSGKTFIERFTLPQLSCESFRDCVANREREKKHERNTAARNVATSGKLDKRRAKGFHTRIRLTCMT